jgi:hypothetical protein
VIGNSRFDIVTAVALRDQFEEDCLPSAEGRFAFMAGLTFRTTSLKKTAAALQAGQIGNVVQTAGRIIVPARHAMNAVLEFIE